MNFHVGQKVVCVKSFRVDLTVNPALVCAPVRGAVYTIRGFSQSPAPGVAIYLEEIVNPVGDYGDGKWEPSFLAHRFRPVKTTSIDCFTALLNPTKEDVRRLEKVR